MKRHFLASLFGLAALVAPSLAADPPTSDQIREAVTVFKEIDRRMMISQRQLSRELLAIKSEIAELQAKRELIESDLRDVQSDVKLAADDYEAKRKQLTDDVLKSLPPEERTAQEASLKDLQLTYDQCKAEAARMSAHMNAIVARITQLESVYLIKLGSPRPRTGGASARSDAWNKLAEKK
jgi:chromosome segregation ATPase